MQILKTGYSKDEQETVCLWDDVNKCWTIESSVRRHMTKLLKQYGDDVEILDCYPNGTPIRVKVNLNMDLVTFRKPMNDERREAMSQQAKENIAKGKGFGQ